MKKTLSSILFMLVCIVLPLQAQAAMQLDNTRSSIHFVSVKKSSVGEVHHFKSLSGSLNHHKAHVNIDLSSVETHVDVRNKRMQTMLFDVATFPTASIDANIDMAKLNNMKSGDTEQQNITLSLDLHGVKKDISTNIQITKLSDGSIMVTSIQPIIVKAADFGLAKGIEALRAIAKLPVIATAVPVTFHLVFSK
jgi:polyisoprenoid-binding protein YceI